MTVLAEARGVGNGDDRGACVDNSLHHAHQELGIGTARILGVELHVVHQALCMLDGVCRALDYLVLAHAQLVLHMDGRDANARDDARALGRLQSLSCRINVGIDGTRECCHDSLVARNGANLGHGAKIARARNGETRLDDVNAHAQQLARNDDLLLGIHGAAGRLLAVAQRSVKDVDLAGHNCFLSSGAHLAHCVAFG